MNLKQAATGLLAAGGTALLAACSAVQGYPNTYVPPDSPALTMCSTVTGLQVTTADQQVYNAWENGVSIPGRNSVTRLGLMLTTDSRTPGLPSLLSKALFNAGYSFSQAAQQSDAGNFAGDNAGSIVGNLADYTGDLTNLCGSYVPSTEQTTTAAPTPPTPPTPPAAPGLPWPLIGAGIYLAGVPVAGWLIARRQRIRKPRNRIPATGIMLLAATWFLTLPIGLFTMLFSSFGDALDRTSKTPDELKAERLTATENRISRLEKENGMR